MDIDYALQMTTTVDSSVTNSRCLRQSKHTVSGHSTFTKPTKSLHTQFKKEKGLSQLQLEIS